MDQNLNSRVFTIYFEFHIQVSPNSISRALSKQSEIQDIIQSNGKLLFDLSTYYSSLSLTKIKPKNYGHSLRYFTSLLERYYVLDLNVLC